MLLKLHDHQIDRKGKLILVESANIATVEGFPGYTIIVPVSSYYKRVAVQETPEEIWEQARGNPLP